MKKICLLFLGVVLVTGAVRFEGRTVRAEGPLRLSQSEIARLTRDGDRLADQGDFLAALEKYTKAYLGVVSDIRGQDFSKDVLPNILNREELGKEMLRLVDEEYTEEEELLMDSSYKVFGFVPPDLDTQQFITELLTEEVAGFYDPDSKRMVLIVEDGPAKDPGWFGRLLGAKPAFDKEEQKTTLAHELTHALQDQLYDLNAMEKGIEDDDDMLLAFSALVEGDATLLMFAEADSSSDVTDMDPEAMRVTLNIMTWMMPLAGGEVYRKAPPIFRESLTFPYLQGMLFSLTVASDKGWESVHQAYSNPPVSTEQILHPAKYVDPDNLDMPQRVKIADLSDAIGEPWTPLGGNCLGELQTAVLLKKVPGGKSAALGWDGDRYQVYRSETGKLAVVSVSIWDSEIDAQQFADAYRKYRQVDVPKRNSKQEPTQVEGLSQPIAPSAGELQVFAADARRLIEVKQDQVWIVEGFDEATCQQVFAKLKDCTFEEKTFPKPQR